MAHKYPPLAIDQPAAYQILVQGWVSERWEDWFEGMRLTHMRLGEETNLPGEDMPEAAETTLLTGILPDQAALLGTLQRLYSFGLPILKVELIPTDRA